MKFAISVIRHPASSFRPNNSAGPSWRRISATVIAAVVTGLTFTTTAGAETTRRPNIIFILADDLGYGDLGCYGQKLIKTPRLDQLAADGMRFTQFYAGSTVAPSRCVLMTGLDTGHCRVREFRAKNPAAQMLEPGDVTVAEVLKSAGYATGLVGKWGLGLPATTACRTSRASITSSASSARFTLTIITRITCGATRSALRAERGFARRHTRGWLCHQSREVC